jgi:hypothetical protein|tara:strand:- start:2640 stop:2834 length:195 start_codon:yes stop_codon:yes gene_type:complete
MKIEEHKKLIALRVKLEDVSTVLNVWASPDLNLDAGSELELVKQRLIEEVDSIKKVLEENVLTY